MSNDKKQKYDIEDILTEYWAQEKAGQGPAPEESRELPPPEPQAEAPQPPAVRPVEAPSPAVSREAAPAPAAEDGEDGAEEEAPARPESLVWKAVRGLFGLVFAAAGLLALSWMLLNVRPYSESAATTVPLRMNLLEELRLFTNNAASDALGDLAYIPKTYAIPETATVAPAPDPACFGSTEDPQEIMRLIESASFLLEGQDVAFDPDANFQPGQPIHYYFDETILAIAWREIIENRCCTFAEIKIQDGSQIRRKLATDTYGSGTQLYASDMAKEANAVIAINGDFYAHRGVGITAYQRKVYRCKGDNLDSCFVTSSGELLFSYAGELTDEAQAQRFVDENDVLFGLTFGPIVVDDGQLRPIEFYPLGEVRGMYSRSLLGTMGDKHYILLTVNIDHSAGCPLPCLLNEAAGFIYDKGCEKAYTLDGGQTSVMIMDGTVLNNVDYGTERIMSDIIYFATALPEKEGAQ